VVHVVENLDVGGLENVVMNLLGNGRTGRYTASLVCLGDGGALAPTVQSRGVRVEALHRHSGLDWILLPRLARILRRGRAAIVHCHNFSPLVYGTVAARLARTRALVYTAHGAKTSGRPQAARMRWFAPRCAYVYISEDARRVATSHGRVPRRVARTVANGIDVERFAQADDRGRIRSSLGIPPDALVVGIVARLAAAKDHRSLFDAFRIVRETSPSTRLLVVGDGPLRGELEEHVRRLNLDNAVVFTGARRDVPALLSAMDLFVLSSQTEGLAMTLLEAMAAGLPVVATRVGGNPEAVADGETGALVVPGDPPELARELIRFLSDASLRERMGAAGRLRATRRFSNGAMRASYEAIYDELLGDLSYE